MTVGEFEKQTSHCPLYLAWRIVDEARDYFRTELIPSPVTQWSDILSHPMGEEIAAKLAGRAEAVFAEHPFWARKASPCAQYQNREFTLKFMRHWPAGVLAKENPVLFRQLPESFKIGCELPENPLGGAAAPPYLKAKMVGLTCRSAKTSRRKVPTNLNSRRARSDAPYQRFVHGCELLPV